MGTHGGPFFLRDTEADSACVVRASNNVVCSLTFLCSKGVPRRNGRAARGPAVVRALLLVFLCSRVKRREGLSSGIMPDAFLLAVVVAAATGRRLDASLRPVVVTDDDDDDVEDKLLSSSPC